jgi:hypothetical protein
MGRRRTAAAERDLLDLLDEGEQESAAARAMRLARAAGVSGEPADLPLGERDRLILRLHDNLFGRAVTAQDTCPHCGEAAEIALTVDALDAVPAAPDGTVRVEADGYRVTCRLLTGRDLLAAVASGGEGRRALLAAAVVAADRDGAPVAPGALPAPVIAVVAAALAEADPFAELSLQLVCAACGRGWDALLDLGHFVWCELRDWGQQLLRDVHVLAHAYGWSEDDVLALAPSRRAAYLRLVLDG